MQMRSGLLQLLKTSRMGHIVGIDLGPLGKFLQSLQGNFCRDYRVME